MSTIYALLITCSVSLLQGTITGVHIAIVTCIVSSPVSIYFLVYSIRAFWGEHRLSKVLGKKKYLNRGLVFVALGLWLFAVFYAPRKPGFAQESCDSILELGGAINIEVSFFGPGWIVVAFAAAISWVISIILARKEIWPEGYRPNFVKVW